MPPYFAITQHKGARKYGITQYYFGNTRRKTEVVFGVLPSSKSGVKQTAAYKGWKGRVHEHVVQSLAYHARRGKRPDLWVTVCA